MKPSQKSHRHPVAFITGASSGIGAALAREYAARKHDLFLCARRADRLRDLAQELSATGVRVEYAACDVTSDEQLTGAVDKARACFGQIDVVLANAGISVTRKVERLTLAEYTRVHETNVVGVLRTVTLTLPDLKKSRGRLAIVGSVMSYVTLPGAAAYCMSKFAVKGLADALREELRPQGVSVTLVCPGFIATEIRSIDSKGALIKDHRDPVPAYLNMPADTAARLIARAVDARRAEAVITLHAKLAILLQRHCPWLVRLAVRMSASYSSKMMAKMN